MIRHTAFALALLLAGMSFALAARAGDIDAAKMIADVPSSVQPPAEATQELRAYLEREMAELIDGWPWAPFHISVGIGSRDYMWAHPSYAVEALALAYPHLSPPLAKRAKELAASELPACLNPEPLPLDKGRRRELFDVPPKDLFWPSRPGWPPVSGVYAVWLYGQRTGDWDSVGRLYPQARGAWQAYMASPIQFPAPQPATGRGRGGSGVPLYMNRTANGLLAFVRLAQRANEPEDASAGTKELDRVLKGILAYDRAQAARVGSALALARQGNVNGGRGTLLYVNLRNHFSKMAIFMDLSPELGKAIAEAEPQAAKTLEEYVDFFMPTFYLGYEERQVHYGENFVELPDSAHGLSQAKAWLWNAPAAKLAEETDIPWVKADLYHMEKLVYAIEAVGRLAPKKP